MAFGGKFSSFAAIDGMALPVRFQLFTDDIL